MINRRIFIQNSFSLIAFAVCSKLLAVGQNDPWPPGDLMQPSELAALVIKADPSLHVICVAFPVLYRQRHIKSAILAGPASKPEGIADLHSALQKLNKSDLIVLYCGCCPMTQCPNIRPAYTAARQAEFQNVRVLNLPSNFHTDWTAKGYPVVE